MRDGQERRQVTEIPAQLLGPLGLLVGLLLVVWTGVKEVWVPGAAYRRLLADRQACEAKADRLAEIAYTNAASARILTEMQRDRAQS